ncbi:hypothetical protein [Streptomyces sp. NPDC003395]
MIQHMNLVFGAEGLNVGEGAFLMACANHTDDRGYVIAHMQQLADEAHMSLRSAQDQRKRLEKRDLIKVKDRYSPKNGAQIANLFRINLALLERMQRQRKDYGPTLIEELTFAERPSSDPHAKSAPPSLAPRADLAPPRADLAPPPADLAPPAPARSAPLLLPSSSPSSLPPVPDATGAAQVPTSADKERETAAPKEQPYSAAGEAADVVVNAYEAAAGARLVNGTRVALRAQAAELLEAGRPVDWLCARAAEMPSKGWVDLIKHCAMSKVPIPGQAGPTRSAGGRERCPDHPARYRKGCPDCALTVPV